MANSNQFKLAGVMGMPIFQSRSPIIHNHWIALHGIKAAYGHFPVQIDQVESAIRGLSALGLAGCNITLPHKVKAMALMDHLTPMAQRVGAINCIVVQADGRLLGMNNDGAGYIQSLRDSDATWRGDAGPALVLGAGGGARSVVVSYVGYPEATQLVTVTAAGTASADVAVGESAVRIEKFVIEGSSVGAARAINQQRAAETLTNLVAADDIGRFPDQNAAESIQRIPGVALPRPRRGAFHRGARHQARPQFGAVERGQRGHARPRQPHAAARCDSVRCARRDRSGEGRDT